MTKKESNIPRSQIKQFFIDELKNKPELKLLNISTADGFLICQVCKSDLSIEGDKISAISSSLYSISNSAINAIFTESTGTIDIESESGKLILSQIQIGERVTVLTICCSDKMALAEGRFLAKRLKTNIESLKPTETERA